MIQLVTTDRAAWNCVWTRPTVERHPVAPGEPPRVWVCVRVPNAWCLVSDDNCTKCPFWEPRDEPENCFW